MKHVTFLTTLATLSRATCDKSKLAPADLDILNAIPGEGDAPSLADADCRPAVDTLSAQAS